MGDLIKRVNAMGFEVKLTDEAKSFLSDKGYDPAFGARPLHRAIQKYVEDPLAEEILRANPKEGDIFELDVDKEKDQLFLKHKGSKKKKETPSS